MRRTRGAAGRPLLSQVVLRAVRRIFGGSRGRAAGEWTSLPAGLLPGSDFDYQTAAGDPRHNSVVAICLGWIGDNFPEPRLCVERRRGPDGRTWEPVDDHPLLRLITCPNPEYDSDALWAATAMSYAAFGNAYWFLGRSDGGRGRVTELWHLPTEQLRPLWPEDGSRFLSGYEYRADGRTLRLRPDEVLHFRFGFEPGSLREGWYRLRAVLREVCTDNEAATMMAALLRNMAVPGVLISPADRDLEARPDEVELLRRSLLAGFSGENRGRPLIATTAWRVDRLGLTPEELVLDRTRNIPEARICGALRIPPMVVGMVVGREVQTFSNYAQARRAAYEDCLAPMHRRFARAVERVLLPELGDPGRERLSWDYRDVSALQDERTELFQQNQLGVQGGWMTVNEARARVGLPPLAGGDALAGRERTAA